MGSAIKLQNAQSQEFSINHLDNAGAISINSSDIAPRAHTTGTATFTATTNNINMTGIGTNIEVGDVIQISGAIDAKNNSEFTVEVITDANNIIVNQAHANKGTSKNVALQAGDTGVTIKLLAKWYNASDSLGRDWVNVTSIRTINTNYPNNIKRELKVKIEVGATAYGYLNDVIFYTTPNIGVSTIYLFVPAGTNYKTNGSFLNWWELR